MSENAHLAVFETYKPASLDRIDFALLIERGETLMGFATCREHDAETLYWQYGGALPGTKSSSLTFPGYQAVVAWSKERYKRITTIIENDNVVMLKFAMKVGFRIVGVRTHIAKKERTVENYNNIVPHILLELVLEF